MRIRSYRAADFDAVDALWRDAFPDDPPRNRAAVAIPAKLAVQPELFLVAIEGDAVLGTAMGGYDGHRGWLYAVAVHGDHRRRGIASALVREVERRLRALGCGKLNLQVRGGNEAVLGLYSALGYHIEDRVSLGKVLD